MVEITKNILMEKAASVSLSDYIPWKLNILNKGEEGKNEGLSNAEQCLCGGFSWLFWAVVKHLFCLARDALHLHLLCITCYWLCVMEWVFNRNLYAARNSKWSSTCFPVIALFFSNTIYENLYK